MSAYNDSRPPLESPLLADEPALVPEAAAAGPLPRDGGTGITLSVEDLLPADDGSVIFEGDVDVALTGACGVREAGTAPADARAGGQDVGGYQFLALESGVTLYYPADAPLVFIQG